jgi:glutamate synthase domain-containing protein 2
MLETGLTPDVIVVDGSEGGTGAAPLEFVDHVGTPLQEGLLLVHNTLVGLNLRHRIKIGCSGKIISAFDIARALALGADWCNSARGFMFALGCLQAQTCHTGKCPTGVATQDPLRQRALAVPDKMERVYRFHHHTMAALRELAQAAGLNHPNEFRATHLVRRVPDNDVRLLSNVLLQVVPGALLEAAAGRGKWPHRVFALYWPQADARSFAPLKVDAESGAVDVERVVHESAA